MEDVIEKAKKIDLDLTHYDQWMMWVVGGVGLLLMFFGYKIKKIAFFLMWFLLGYILTGYLMPMLNSVIGEPISNDFWQTLIPILGGLLLGLMGFMIEKICLWGICFGLAMMATVQYFGTEFLTIAIGGVVGAVVASLAVMMMKPATIFATAFAGSYALTLAILALVPDIDRGIWFWPMIAGFSFVGAIVQFLTDRK